ncbi:major capsid protein [Reyranella sp.]|uniref:major capsid protein n=1 Tax=Reyranella sp. TaxID=1929291 RepID=UPI003C7E9841
MPDIYTTAVLARTVELLPPPSTFLLDTFFPGVQTGDTEEIHFDIDTSKPRITPFVHPTVAGKVVADRGFATKSFKPAYAKDKRILMPNAPIKRRAGERIGGSLNPMQRRSAQLAQNLQDQLDMLTRREVVMAAEALRLGQVTVSGTDYPTVVVNFGRDASLTVALTGGNRWGQAGVGPLDSLETWAGVIMTKSGAKGTTVVMDPKAWALFRADATVQLRLNTLYAGQRGSLDLGPQVRGMGKGRARYVGNIGDFDLWVYQDVYVDEAGTTQQILPDYTVLMGAPGDEPGTLEGVRCYGNILDEEAGYKSQRYFVKSWLEKDPAVRMLLLQSAPLVVPFRPNASFCATVN